MECWTAQLHLLNEAYVLLNEASVWLLYTKRIKEVCQPIALKIKCDFIK